MAEDQALQQLHEILARPEYQGAPAESWWAQLLAPFVGLALYFIARLIQTIIGSANGSEGWVGLVVLALCAVLIGAVGVYLVRAVRLAVTRDHQVAQLRLADRRERSDRLWQTAHQLAAAGQWTEAVRLVYLSALYALDERTLLSVEQGQTNREHARRLARAHPELGPSFAAVVERYDRVRYGSGAATGGAFDELRVLVERTRTAALRGSPG
jgi:hypothetical protein